MNTNGNKSPGDPFKPHSGDLNKPPVNRPEPLKPVNPDLSTNPKNPTPSVNGSINAGQSSTHSEKPPVNGPKIHSSANEWETLSGESFEDKEFQGKKTTGTDYSQNYKEQSSKQSYHKETAGDKIKGAFEEVKNTEFFRYASTNKEQTLTYILLALGIILLFADNLYLLGGLLIGGIAGYHFAPEIIYYLKNMGQIFAGQNRLRYIVLTVLLLGLFIAAPGIFVGAAVVAAFTQVLSKKERGNEGQWGDRQDTKNFDADRNRQKNDKNYRK